MDVLHAIQARHSVRDFLPTPVARDILMKILETATLSPSGGNGQPWEIFIATGATMEKIRSAYLERARNAPPGPPPGPGSSSGTPPPPFILERMSTIRNERLKLLGLDPADPASGKVLMELGARLYGTPVLAVICMHSALSSNFDLGMLAQTICLAAQGYGVDSIIAAALIAHRDILREALEIPEELTIIAGVALGYANPEHIINTYRSPRRPISEVVRFKN